MEEERLISVLINNYNYSQYVGEAIESVMNQTWTNWELIVVDDGSKDDSREVIQAYCNKYPDKIKGVFKENGGQASAMNAGYEKARGDIIAFLDSDDYWLPHKLSTVVKYHEEYDFVGHRNQYSIGKMPWQSLYMEERRRDIFRRYGRPCTYALTTSSISFNRTLAEKIMPVPELNDFRVCADQFMKFMGLYYSNIKYLTDELTYYRIHGENAYFGTSKCTEEYMKRLDRAIIEQINLRLKERNEPIVPACDLKQLKIMCEKEDNFVVNPGKYVLYGTGSASKTMREFVEFCGGSIVYYSDSVQEKWGTKKEGVEIISPKKLLTSREQYDRIIIASMFIKEISMKLSELGLKKDQDYIYSELLFV